MLITIEKAVISEAEKLTEITKKTFDEEARKWLPRARGTDPLAL